MMKRLLKKKHKISLCFVLLLVFIVSVFHKTYLVEHIIAFIARSLTIPTTFIVNEDNSKNVQYYNELDSVYLLNQPDLCEKRKPFIVIMIKSAPMHFLRRQAIRETWGNMSRWFQQKNVYGLLLFSLGTNKVNFNKQKLINREHTKYSDIIQESYIDSFYNLTRKVSSQIKWVNQFCFHAKYFMTTDDDMYVNIPNLLEYLMSKTQKYVYVGCVHFGSSPNRDRSSKYYVPRAIYPGLYYPDYCPGAGYVLSVNVVQLLFKQIFAVPMLYIDDVFIGLLLNRINIVPEHNARFFCEAKVPLDPCIYNYFITSHGYSELEMHTFEKNLNKLSNVGFFCSLKLWYKEISLFS